MVLGDRARARLRSERRRVGAGTQQRKQRAGAAGVAARRCAVGGVEQRRVNVDERDDAPRNARGRSGGGGGGARRAEDEGDARRALVQRTLLPRAMLESHLAVVAHNRHQRRCRRRIQHGAREHVGLRDLCEVRGSIRAAGVVGRRRAAQPSGDAHRRVVWVLRFARWPRWAERRRRADRRRRGGGRRRVKRRVRVVEVAVDERRPRATASGGARRLQCRLRGDVRPVGGAAVRRRRAQRERAALGRGGIAHKIGLLLRRGDRRRLRQRRLRPVDRGGAAEGAAVLLRVAAVEAIPVIVARNVLAALAACVDLAKLAHAVAARAQRVEERQSRGALHAGQRLAARDAAQPARSARRERSSSPQSRRGC